MHCRTLFCGCLHFTHSMQCRRCCWTLAIRTHTHTFSTQAHLYDTDTNTKYVPQMPRHASVSVYADVIVYVCLCVCALAVASSCWGVCFCVCCCIHRALRLLLLLPIWCIYTLTQTHTNTFATPYWRTPRSPRQTGGINALPHTKHFSTRPICIFTAPFSHSVCKFTRSHWHRNYSVNGLCVENKTTNTKYENQLIWSLFSSIVERHDTNLMSRRIYTIAFVAVRDLCF